jgi:sulfite exporter TauE/SafE
MTGLVLGFLIALGVGLAGIGGGSFTVPALLLLVGLPASEAVGTAFVFAGVLRLIAAPFYLFGRQVHSRYARLLLLGALPGLLIGMLALRSVVRSENTGLVTLLLGVMLAGFVQRDFLSARAKPAIRGEKFPVASMARFSYWRGIRILLGGGWCPRRGAFAELFGDGANSSDRHGYFVRARSGALEPRFDQYSGAVAAFGGRHTGGPAGLPACSDISGPEAQSRHRCVSHLRWSPTGMVGIAVDGSKASVWFDAPYKRAGKWPAMILAVGNRGARFGPVNGRNYFPEVSPCDFLRLSSFLQLL